MQVRNARPADLDALLETHLLAFDGTLGVALGRRYVSRFLQFFLRAESAVGVLVRDDAHVLAYVFGAPDGYSAALSREVGLARRWALLTHPGIAFHPRFWSRLIGILSRTGEAPVPRERPVFDLVGIGVHPSARGRGLAASVLSEFEAQVWARGYASMVLDVYADNAKARRVYEAAGWTEIWTGRGVVRYARIAPSGSAPQRV